MTVDSTLRALDVPRLVVTLPDGKEVHHHIAGEEVTIGRDPSNRICLSDNFVSKFHAKLLVSGRTITLVDLGSANKTYVNGEPIAQKPLRYGDTIRFASVECRLEGPEGAAKLAPAAASPARAAAPPTPAPAPERAAPAPGPEPPAAPSPKPAKARPAVAAKSPGRPGPPPVEADPMKKLLVVGGVLILVSLVLGVVLRILLVPSDAPAAATEESRPEGAQKAAPAPAAASTPPPSTQTAPSPEPSSPSSSPGPIVDARGNRSAEFYFDEGLSYLDTGRLKEAQASFRKVLELDPDHSRARTRLSLLDEEIEAKATRHFDAAREAFQFLRYDEAIAEWEMFLLLADPGDVRYAEAQGGIEQAKAKLR